MVSLAAKHPDPEAVSLCFYAEPSEGFRRNSGKCPVEELQEARGEGRTPAFRDTPRAEQCFGGRVGRAARSS